jgi:hypothetical protein
VNEEIKAQWVQALRSGEYKQGQGALRSDDNTYCCLGVLCDLAVKDGKAHWFKKELRTFDGYGNQSGRKLEEGWRVLDRDGGHDGGVPTKIIVEWAGLEQAHPLLGDSGAIGLNDGERASFERIADLIEEHL